MKRILVIVAALAVVVAVALAGYTRSTERARSVDYRGSRSDVAIPGTTWCADVDSRAKIHGTTSPSGILGWSEVRISDPYVRVEVTPCRGSGASTVDGLVVSNGWTPRSCRLNAVADEFDADEEEYPEYPQGWVIQPADCSNGAVDTTSIERSNSLSVSGNVGVDFAGRTWTQDLCFDPIVYVEVSSRSEEGAASITGVPVRLDPACLKR